MNREKITLILIFFLLLNPTYACNNTTCNNTTCNDTTHDNTTYNNTTYNNTTNNNTINYMDQKYDHVREEIKKAYKPNKWSDGESQITIKDGYLYFNKIHSYFFKFPSREVNQEIGVLESWLLLNVKKYIPDWKWTHRNIYELLVNAVYPDDRCYINAWAEGKYQYYDHSNPVRLHNMTELRSKFLTDIIVWNLAGHDEFQYSPYRGYKMDGDWQRGSNPVIVMPNIHTVLKLDVPDDPKPALVQMRCILLDWMMQNRAPQGLFTVEGVRSTLKGLLGDDSLLELNEKWTGDDE